MIERAATSSLLVGSLLIFAGCASDSPITSEPDPSEPLALGAAPSYDSFEHALRVEPDAAPTMTDEVSAEQVDYYVFHATEGSFYEIATENDTYSPDNVITLLDSAHREIAKNDSGSRFLGDEFDARLVVRIPATGDYYVKVEDLRTPAEFFASRFPLLFYHLSLRTLGASPGGYAHVGEDGKVAASFATDPATGYRFLTVFGEFHGETARVELAGASAHALIARVHAGGAGGDGSTVDHPRVTIRAPGGQVLAMLDTSASREAIRPPVSEGNHQVDFDARGPVGANAFFAMDLVLLEDNPAEKNEAGNGVPGGAETLSFSRGTSGRALLLARVPAGDVDHFEVPAKAGTSVLVSCEGESTGSGVRGLRVEVLDPTGNVLLSAQEGDDGLELRASFASRLPHYVRLSSSNVLDSAQQVEAWVRCAVLVN